MDGGQVERVLAVERYRKGEPVEAICTSLRRSRSWFYKWLERAEQGQEEWYEEHSRRRHHSGACEDELRQRVVEMRQRLEAEGSFVSAQMIAWELEAQQIAPPSMATIKRILNAAGLTVPKRRSPKGTKYPAPLAIEPSAVHQVDFVGPRHAKGIKFYSLNAVDVSTARAAVEPVHSRATEHVIPALWSMWTRLGVPTYLQLDNELVFFGNRRHPHALGQVMRLCFELGIELIFIPVREPWRNSVIEKFNDHWNRKFYRRIVIESFEALRPASLLFESRHNSTWRYSKLQGLTPNMALTASTATLRFPDRPTPPPMPFGKPTRGQVSFIRLIRSDLQLEIFGQRFRMPPQASHEYVRATIDVAARELRVVLYDEIIQTHPYSIDQS
jgi:putative transposase